MMIKIYIIKTKETVKLIKKGIYNNYYPHSNYCRYLISPSGIIIRRLTACYVNVYFSYGQTVCGSFTNDSIKRIH